MCRSWMDAHMTDKQPGDLPRRDERHSAPNLPRLANLSRRAALWWDTGTLDVYGASGGRWGPDPHSALEDWERFWDWAAGVEPAAGGTPDPVNLGPPVPRPRQVFAIGLNYRDHAAEAGYVTDGLPQVFTKFPSCLAGPVSSVAAVSSRLDWEVELVAVIGRTAERVPEERGWDFVAGAMVGQDLSARDVQLAGESPQWSLGKSFPGFGPTGPQLVSPYELARPDDLEIECSVNGETVQHSRTSHMIWSLPQLVARLSSVCTLLPGDLIFTGTPAGVGNRRNPPRYLRPGDRLVSRIGGIGELTVDVVEA